MKIAYLTTYDSGDIKHWSGLGYYMRKCLAEQGVEVIPVNCSVPFSRWILLKAKLIKLVLGKSYQLERDHQYLRSIAIKAKTALELIEHDVVFSPGSLPIVYLSINKPIVFWADATYDCLLDFYHSSDSLSTESLINGNLAEQMAISKASLIFYASDWGRNSAVKKYTANPDKVTQIPFGANIEKEYSSLLIKQLISKRIQKNKVKLLFIGVDWNRKGGDLLIQTVELLKNKGLNIELTIAGCKIPESVRSLPYVINHSYISKQTKFGLELINLLYEEATFLLLPSRAECFGIVVAEANSKGLPVISSNVGGLTSAVKNNVNGFCLEIEKFAEQGAELILEYYKDNKKYETLSLNAFDYFKKELNWPVLGKRAVSEMEKLLQ